jgi:hypothetical protein
MNEAEQRLDSLCSKIIESDKAIRFVGIPNKMGNQLISRYRSGLTPLLTPSEIEMYAIQTVLRMNTRKDFELKLGKPIYSFTLYQKVKRVTITLENKEYPILMASFDVEADHDNIIVHNIVKLGIEKEASYIVTVISASPIQRVILVQACRQLCRFMQKWSW